MTKFHGVKPKASPFGKDEPPAAPKNPDSLPPVFSFEFMVDGNGYSVNCCNADHRAALAARMFLLSRVTWLQIRQAQRHGIGSEKIAKNAITAALPAVVTDDVDLLAIRYNGYHPMVGFRNGRIFNVLFVDHTMDVYPHE